MNTAEEPSNFLNLESCGLEKIVVSMVEAHLRKKGSEQLWTDGRLKYHKQKKKEAII